MGGTPPSEGKVKKINERKTDNKSGGAGSNPKRKRIGDDVEWEKGNPKTLITPKVKSNNPFPPNLLKDHDGNRPGGANVGTLPEDPNGPIDSLLYKTFPSIVEDDMPKFTYMKRLAKSIEAKNKADLASFNSMIGTLKSLFPEMKMHLPDPPTYIWNPKEKDAKLDAKAIKDLIKVKFSKIKWSMRLLDGVDTAELTFPDGSAAEFEIGASANHLTITYQEPEEEEFEPPETDEELTDLLEPDDEEEKT